MSLVSLADTGKTEKEKCSSQAKSMICLFPLYKKTVALFLVLISSSNVAFGQGGPPLVTDDPGTPGNNHWEINAALQWTPAGDGNTLQFPLLDMNYGWGDRLQLNLVVGWINAAENGIARTSGLSSVSTAVKWRFVDENTGGVAISIYPRIDSLWPGSSRDPVVNRPGARYFLPIEFSKRFGRFGINPEIGYAYQTQGDAAEWAYGIASSFEIEKDRELLFELHSRAPFSTSQQESLYNFGTRFAVTEFGKFIGAIGHSLTVLQDGSPFWIVYLGAQLQY